MSSNEEAPANKNETNDVAIENETRRIIKDHLPTILSTIIRREPADLEAISQEKIEKQIRTFFSSLDSIVDDIAKELTLKTTTTILFKVMLRKLYQVVSIERHIAALKAAECEVQRLINAGYEVVVLASDSQSTELFERSFSLTKVGKMIKIKSLNDLQQNKSNKQAILILDDVAHSGAQLAGKIQSIKNASSDIRIVVSLAAITERALQRLKKIVNMKHLMYQQKIVDLESLIETTRNKKIKEELYKLAETFFKRQRESLRSGLEATHIITPFKLPDSLSNSMLGIIAMKNAPTLTFLTKSNWAGSALYPTSL